MNKMLKFEFKKLWKSKSLYICSAILVALVCIGAYTIYLVSHSASTQGSGDVSVAVSGSITGFSNLFSALGGNFSMLLAVFAALFVSIDFSNDTMRIIVARGYSQTVVYLSKLIAASVGTAFMVLVTWAASFIAGTCIGGVGTVPQAQNFVLLLVQFIVILAFTALFTMISMIIKKSGMSIAVCIIINTVVSLVVMGIDAMINSKVFTVSSFLIDTFLKNVSSLDADAQAITKSLVGSIIYIIIFTIAGIVCFKKSDVK